VIFEPDQRANRTSAFNLQLTARQKSERQQSLLVAPAPIAGSLMQKVSMQEGSVLKFRRFVLMRRFEALTSKSILHRQLLHARRWRELIYLARNWSSSNGGGSQ
jgi:hypothetical protein